ncbi:hypothetical protein L5876_09715 [Hyphobacterium sp. SN044]|uniref:hypothetical protein n=1 Tax=Hyphobacterium sp. SN044 TaxID=2912575 RepID=UPI001F17CF91|nr:hypothetical protein [Hyphobacterium sp. SN044]MCF8880091.1 hypothetical protein [Hyphobacterium sp. SN044]
MRGDDGRYKTSAPAQSVLSALASEMRRTARFAAEMEQRIAPGLIASRNLSDGEAPQMIDVLVQRLDSLAGYAERLAETAPAVPLDWCDAAAPVPLAEVRRRLDPEHADDPGQGPVQSGDLELF